MYIDFRLMDKREQAMNNVDLVYYSITVSSLHRPPIQRSRQSHTCHESGQFSRQVGGCMRSTEDHQNASHSAPGQTAQEGTQLLRHCENH